MTSFTVCRTGPWQRRQPLRSDGRRVGTRQARWRQDRLGTGLDAQATRMTMGAAIARTGAVAGWVFHTCPTAWSPSSREKFASGNV